MDISVWRKSQRIWNSRHFGWKVLLNCAGIEFNDRLVDIYAGGNFSDFRQLAKFANIFMLLK
jgi:hypothetical protein